MSHHKTGTTEIVIGQVWESPEGYAMTVTDVYPWGSGYSVVLTSEDGLEVCATDFRVLKDYTLL